MSPQRRVLVVCGRGDVTTLTDAGTRVEPLRTAWQIDEFAAALGTELAAEVRVIDELKDDDVEPETAVIGTGSTMRALAGRVSRLVLIELGVGSSSGLRHVEEAGLDGGIDFEAYRAWQRDRQARGRMFGRIDIAEHMGAHIALRSATHCSLWIKGPVRLPQLVAWYLQACTDLVPGSRTPG